MIQSAARRRAFCAAPHELKNKECPHRLKMGLQRASAHPGRPGMLRIHPRRHRRRTEDGICLTLSLQRNTAHRRRDVVSSPLEEGHALVLGTWDITASNRKITEIMGAHTAGWMTHDVDVVRRQCGAMSMRQRASAYFSMLFCSESQCGERCMISPPSSCRSTPTRPRW